MVRALRCWVAVIALVDSVLCFLPQITSQFQCARLTGLDSRDGILLLGSTHFYVVEGVTFLKSGELIDIESAEQG